MNLLTNPYNQQTEGKIDIDLFTAKRGFFRVILVKKVPPPLLKHPIPDWVTHMDTEAPKSLHNFRKKI